MILPAPHEGDGGTEGLGGGGGEGGDGGAGGGGGVGLLRQGPFWQPATQ